MPLEDWPNASRFGQYLYCPEGSHLGMYDDRTYFWGLLEFLRGL